MLHHTRLLKLLSQSTYSSCSYSLANSQVFVRNYSLTPNSITKLFIDSFTFTSSMLKFGPSTPSLTSTPSPRTLAPPKLPACRNYTSNKTGPWRGWIQ